MVLSATLGHDTPPPYVYLFPQLCFICVHMPISELSSLVQFLYMPAIVRQSMC